MTECEDFRNEVLFYNGKIWASGEQDYSWFTFNTTHKRITDIGRGSNPNQQNYKEAHDLHKCRVFPGFHDSHIHASSVGKAAVSVDLNGCRSITEMQQKIKEFKEQNAHLEKIYGRGWEQDVLGSFPTKEDIDKVCPDKPVLLKRVCGHLFVGNSLILKIAGITKNTPDPSGGVIDRYPEGHVQAGEPTGVFREEPAMDLISEKHWHVSDQEKMEQIRIGLDICLKYGLTAVHTNEGEIWKQYCAMAKEDKLPIRVFMACYYTCRNSDNFPDYAGVKFNQMLSCDRVKLFADGSLGGCTAALSKCYKHDNHKGVLLYEKEEFNRLVKKATCEGYRLEIHVIGDEAAEMAVSALEQAQVSPEKRPILTHCQILREDLIPRMKDLGVIANIQPQFVTTDARWVPELLPQELIPWAYAWKSLLDHGVHCAGGSDAPVETPEPLIGIYDAIFRPNGNRNPEEMTTFIPKEKLSVREAVDLYTKAGAYTTFREQDLGQLLPGFFADFVVIADGVDPVADPRLFLSAQIGEVWVDGKMRYKRG